jgi:SAM-dependent methyltransferase/biotin operon repressor
MAIENGEQLLGMMRGFQVSCVLAAGADLDVFNLLTATPLSAAEVAERLGCDRRAMTILLDALSSIGVLVKSEGRYAVATSVAPLVIDGSPHSAAAMLRHQANCLRRWARLPWVVQTGCPADAGTSVRGREADRESFIGAMHDVSNAVAEPLIREINPGGFRCVLDIGGGPGTWTLAWLQAEPASRAILFDLPEVIPLASQRLTDCGVAERVELVAGDFYVDSLPRGADLAWLSAIIHQNSPEQNRALYRRVAEALEPGGRLLIRDIVMEDSRTAPLAGALFAVNMLVATPGGGTYTLAEIRDELQSAGFEDIQLIRRDEGMHAVISARRV